MDRRRFSNLPAPLGSKFAGVDRPFVLSPAEQLRNNIQAAIDDEGAAAPDYEIIAADAREMGLDSIAEAFESAASDEKRHKEMFQRELLDLEVKIEDEQLRRSMD